MYWYLIRYSFLSNGPLANLITLLLAVIIKVSKVEDRIKCRCLLWFLLYESRRHLEWIHIHHQSERFDASFLLFNEGCLNLWLFISWKLEYRDFLHKGSWCSLCIKSSFAIEWALSRCRIVSTRLMVTRQPRQLGRLNQYHLFITPAVDNSLFRAQTNM